MTRQPEASMTSSPSSPVPTAAIDSPSISTSASNASVAVTTRPPRMTRLIRGTLYGSGHLVNGTVAALGRGQAPALGGDRAALHAVGGVDDQVDHALRGRVLRDLVDAGRAHPGPALGHLARDALLDADVRRGVVAGRVAGEEDARELVERVLAVRLRIALVPVAQGERRLGVAVGGPVAAGEAALGHHHRVG